MYVNCSFITGQKTRVQAIYKICRPGEEEHIRKMKLENHKLLWHGSSTANFISILHRGLLVAPSGIPITGHLYGEVRILSVISWGIIRTCRGPFPFFMGYIVTICLSLRSFVFLIITQPKSYSNFIIIEIFDDRFYFFQGIYSSDAFAKSVNYCYNTSQDSKAKFAVLCEVRFFIGHHKLFRRLCVFMKIFWTVHLLQVFWWP